MWSPCLHMWWIISHAMETKWVGNNSSMGDASLKHIFAIRRTCYPGLPVPSSPISAMLKHKQIPLPSLHDLWRPICTWLLTVWILTVNRLLASPCCRWTLRVAADYTKRNSNILQLPVAGCSWFSLLQNVQKKTAFSVIVPHCTGSGLTENTDFRTVNLTIASNKFHQTQPAREPDPTVGVCWHLLECLG